MLADIGVFFADNFKKWLPNSYIFALLLTIVSAVMAIVWVDSTPLEIIQSWYKGFFILLKFAMQMVLILATGYAIAISPPASKGIDLIASKIQTPAMVYVIVVFVGCLFSFVSWGWIVLTGVLARELAKRIKKVDYCLLSACVYTTLLPWHGGLSGSIPLLLNTPDNFLITTGTLSYTIATSKTLMSPMNIICQMMLLISLPILMVLMKPSKEKVQDFYDLKEHENQEREMTVAQEAQGTRLPFNNLSDSLNNSKIILFIVATAGMWFLGMHFRTNGFDINLNVIIFSFIIIGMFCHLTPLRYEIAMKRACSNISGIILQFPFYAGIMGIMIHTGLGKAIAILIAGSASVETFPIVSFISGGVVNIFIPSGGGEWAVIGPTIIKAAGELGAHMSPEQLADFIAKTAMAVAYGDSCTNMIQPFWTLTFFPIISAGVKMQARDIMGYTFVACLWSTIVFIFCVKFVPI